MRYTAFIVYALLLSCASAARLTGTASFDENTHFAFLGKFVFDYSHNCTQVTLEECRRAAGTVDLQLTVESLTANLSHSEKTQVLFFDDQDDSWFTVYKRTDLTCEQLVNRSISPNRNKLKFVFDSATNRWIYDQRPINIKQHLRPRFWYLGIADCDRQLGELNIKYDLIMQNVQEGAWTIEFGTDQRGINTLYVFFFSLYTILMVVQIYNVFVFKRDGVLHPMIQLFVISMSLMFASVLCQLIHFTRFSNGGVGVPFLNIFGEVFGIFAHLSFMLLLILIAQGWTITENAIYHRKQLLGGLVFFTVLYVVALFLARSTDPASTSYTYSSVPGILAAVGNALSGVWFLYSIYKSYKIEADIYKQHLYVKVAFIFAAWFWALPVELLIAAVASPWVRDIVVTTLSICVSTLGYLAMAYLLWPSRAANYFAVTVTSNMQMAVAADKTPKGEALTDNMLGDSDYSQL